MKTFFANNIQNYIGMPIPSGSTCILVLSQNAVSLIGNIIVQTRYVISIDSNGSFSQQIWFNDELNPSGTGYNIQIQIPNVGIVYNQRNVPITGANFNLALFVPGSQSTAIGFVFPTLETNGVVNPNQLVLNLKAGTNISLTADGVGGVTVAGSDTGDVTSVFTRTGDVVATIGDYNVAQVTGAAPLASPTFTGTPSLPTGTTGVTQAASDNSTKLATTAYADRHLVASGQATLGTTLITSGSKATLVTESAPGVLSTDCVEADFSVDPSGITGWAPSANGMLTIIKFCSLNTVNFYVYNNTGASVTPGQIGSPLTGMVLNWLVVR